MTLTNDQIQILQTNIGVVKSLGLSPADTQLAELDTVEAGLAESGLKNDNYGDYPSSMGGQMSSSRGEFQQISAWGPLSAREDVAQATRMFLTGGQGGQRGLLDVPGWNKMNSWNAVQAVQGSEFSDGSNYQAQYDEARQLIDQYGAGAPPVTPGTPIKATPPGGTAASPGTATGVPASTTAQPAGLFSGVESGVLTFALEALFIMTGLGLAVLGVWRISAPARNKISNLPIPIPV